MERDDLDGPILKCSMCRGAYPCARHPDAAPIEVYFEKVYLYRLTLPDGPTELRCRWHLPAGAEGLAREERGYCAECDRRYGRG